MSVGRCVGMLKVALLHLALPEADETADAVVRIAVSTIERHEIKICCSAPEPVHNATKLNVNPFLWRKKDDDTGRRQAKQGTRCE
jgi:hypothetical protein